MTDRGPEGGDYQQLEDTLRAAFREQAESVVVSDDALSRLQAAAKADQRSWWISDRIRPLAVAAATIVAVGTGVVVLNQTQRQDVVTFAPADSASSAIGVDGEGRGRADTDQLDRPLDDGETGEIEAANMPGADETAADGEAGGDNDEKAPPELPTPTRTPYAPIGATGTEAVDRWLALIDPDSRFGSATSAVDEGDRVQPQSAEPNPVESAPEVVGPPDDGGTGTVPIGAGAVAAVDRLDSGFVVAAVDAPVIDFSIGGGAVGRGAEGSVTAIGPTLELTGRSDLFGVSVEVEVVSARDGSVLAETSVQAGSRAQGGEFRVLLPLVGSDRGWLVVRPSAEAVAAGDAPAVFSARPVLIQGNPDTADYTVVGLKANDADGGLVVRSTPAGERIGVIPLGATGVRLRSQPPEVVGTFSWSPVITPNGTEGWVATKLLAPDREISAATLTNLAEQFVAAVGSGDYTLPPDLAPARSLYAGMLDRPLLVRDDVNAESTWNRRRPLPGGEGSRTTTLAELNRTALWPSARVVIDDEFGSDQAMRSAVSRFGTLASVVIETVDPDTASVYRTRLFVSRQPDGLAGPPFRLHGVMTEAERIPPSSPATNQDGADDGSGESSHNDTASGDDDGSGGTSRGGGNGDGSDDNGSGRGNGRSSGD